MRAKPAYPNKGRFLPSVWGVSMFVLAVVIAVALVGSYFNDHAQGRVRAQVLLSSIEEDAAEQAIAEYEAIGEGEVTPEVAEDVADNRRELAEALDELGRLNPGDEELARVVEGLGAYEASVDEELRLIEAGQIDEAKLVDEERVDPGFKALQDLLEDTAARYDAEARRANLLADTATYIAAVLAAAMLVAVARYWQREQARRSEQEALRRSEERFRSLAQNSSDVVTVVDANRNVLYQSPSIEKILGHDPEGRVGKNLAEQWLVHPDDAAEQDTAFAQAVANPGEGVVAETRMRHRDGSWRWMEVTYTSLLDDHRVGGVVLNARDVTERKRAEEELRRSERFLAEAQRIARVGSWEYEANVGEARWSDELYRILGLAPGQFAPTRETFMGFVHPEDRPLVERSGRAASDRRGRSSVEFRVVRVDGRVRVVQNHHEVVFDGEEAARPSRVTGTVQDVTERKRTEEELARLASFPELNPSPVIEVSLDGKVTYANRAAEGLFPDLQTAGLTHPVLADLAEALPKLPQSDRKRLLGEAEVGGAFYHLEAYVPPGAEGLVRLYATDITARKALEQEFAYRAFHDDLTGLPNRALFLERLGHALARTERRENRVVAVLFMDLDNFKYINDSLTHEAGDQLLVRVAERLKCCVGPGDTLARFGGDEFTVLLENSGPDEASALAERIAEELKAPFDLDGREVSVTFSIGIALGGPDMERPADLLRNADLAMYAAKAQGKNTHKKFESGMAARVAERLRLENELRRAVDLGGEEFVVHYQPKVELATGAVVGFEALVRWEHPKRGTVSPAGFVPLAEETGLIVPLGRRVLEEACRQAKRWRDERPKEPPTKLCVNLSAREFQRPDLAESVAEVLEKTGLEPRSLDLEITESLAMENTARTVDALQALKELGVGLSIDDFGTGHSSLSYLRRFPVDNLKMDKTFVDTLGHSREDTALVSTTIELAHAFGLEVVAEGVETTDQLERLRQLGCDLAQGYYFSKPLPVEAASALLAAERGNAPYGSGAAHTL